MNIGAGKVLGAALFAAGVAAIALVAVAVAGCGRDPQQDVDPRIADATRPIVMLTHATEPPHSYVNVFIDLFLMALVLRCCTRAFSSCGEPGATLHQGALASDCDGFSC